MLQIVFSKSFNHLHTEDQSVFDRFYTYYRIRVFGIKLGRLTNLAQPHSYLIVQIRWSVFPVGKISSVRWPKILHFENMKLSSKVIKSMTPLKRPWTTLLFIVANKSSNRIMSLNPIFFFHLRHFVSCPAKTGFRTHYSQFLGSQEGKKQGPQT